jgi:hypothetical protein
MSEPARVVWRELRDPTPDLFRCDLPGCDQQADSIHLVPWCNEDCEAALFACPRHDPGGYHFTVADYLGDRIDWHRHLDEKIDHGRRYDPHRPGGLVLLLRRIEELTRPIVTAAGGTRARSRT